MLYCDALLASVQRRGRARGASVASGSCSVAAAVSAVFDHHDGKLAGRVAGGRGEGRTRGADYLAVLLFRRRWLCEFDCFQIARRICGGASETAARCETAGAVFGAWPA